MLKIINQLNCKDKQRKKLAKLKLKSSFFKIIRFKKEKNILILLRHLTNGGAEKSLINLANNLSQKYNVLIVTADKTNPDFECNVKIIEIPNLGNNKVSIEKLHNIKKKYKITHSISGSIAFNFLNVSARYHDKIIITVQTMLSIKTQKEMEIKRINLANEFADKIVCVSKEVADDQILNFHANKRKVKVIYNYLDLNEISNMQVSKNENERIIITAGRLEKVKNHYSLIKAFKEVNKEYPNVKLWILGRGSEETNLKNLIKKLDLTNKVQLLGFQKNVYEYLLKSYVFIFTSTYEGFGNVLIDALACQLPVVSTDCSAGPREILAPNTDYKIKTNYIDKSEYGVLIPPIKESAEADKLTASEKNISKILLEFLNNKKLYNYYRKQAIKRAQDFDQDKILKYWDELIK